MSAEQGEEWCSLLRTGNWGARQPVQGKGGARNSQIRKFSEIACWIDVISRKVFSTVKIKNEKLDI